MQRSNAWLCHTCRLSGAGVRNSKTGCLHCKGVYVHSLLYTAGGATHAGYTANAGAMLHRTTHRVSDPGGQLPSTDPPRLGEKLSKPRRIPTRLLGRILLLLAFVVAGGMPQIYWFLGTQQALSCVLAQSMPGVHMAAYQDAVAGCRQTNSTCRACRPPAWSAACPLTPPTMPAGYVWYWHQLTRVAEGTVCSARLEELGVAGGFFGPWC